VTLAGTPISTARAEFPAPCPAESDTNSSAQRRAWDAALSADVLAASRRDAAVYLRQAVSTPCLGALAGASGSYLIAVDGTRYLDFHGNSAHQIGYGHPRLRAALAEQLATLPFVPRRYTSGISVEWAEELLALAPAGLDRVLMTTGGSDAVEVALKLARAATGRHKTLSFWDSFHGAGFGAASVGGEQLFRNGPIGPLLSGTEHVPPLGCHRAVLGPSHRADEPHHPECGVALAALIDYTLRVQGDVAALIAEPMRATPAMAAPGFWQAVRRSCDDTGTLLIFDEIPTALGRTGRFFACEHEGVAPDLLVVGKGLGGGAIPVAAVLARRDLDVGADWAFGHYTHEKNPLMARAALTTLQIIADEQLVVRSNELGEYALTQLRSIAASARCLGDTRGRGLALGVDIVEDAANPNSPGDPHRAERIMYECLRRGLSFKLTMGVTATLTPALTISRRELDEGLGIFADAVAATG